MKTISFFISLFIGLSLYAQPQDVSVVFHKPTEHFTESLPIGNGRLGAMFFGKTDVDRIILNEISLWSGGTQDADDPNAHIHLKTIQQLLLCKNILSLKEKGLVTVTVQMAAMVVTKY